MNNYLKIYCEEVLNALGYSYTNEDIDKLVNMFDEAYLADFEAYQVWWNVIDKYYEDKENSD